MGDYEQFTTTTTATRLRALEGDTRITYNNPDLQMLNVWDSSENIRTDTVHIVACQVSEKENIFSLLLNDTQRNC